MTKKIILRSLFFIIIFGLLITYSKQNFIVKKENENLNLFFEEIVKTGLKLDKINDSKKQNSTTEEEKISKFNEDYTEYLLSTGKIAEALEVMLTSSAILPSDFELMTLRSCVVYPVRQIEFNEYKDECFRSW